MLFVCLCFQLLMIPLIMSVLYVWAQFNKDMIVSFWFGTRFKVAHVLSLTRMVYFYLVKGLLKIKGSSYVLVM